MTVDENNVAQLRDANLTDPKDTPDPEPVNQQRVNIGLHPLGGIALNVTDASGETAGAFLSVDEAMRVAGHIHSLATILIHSAYVEAAEAQKKVSGLFVPGR